MARRSAGMKTLDVRTRAAWRRWLREHHASETEVWLVFHKRGTGVDCVEYEDSVEEALCYGWVDSLVKRLDDRRYARKFTPRTAGSRWSTINRRRWEKLKAQGLLAAPGLERAPTDRSGDSPPVSDDLPPYIEQRLRANSRAWANFERLTPSYRRMYIAWIDSAKRDDTREKRLREALELLEAGKRLGLK